MRCDECEHWTTRRITRYDGGEEIVSWQAASGQGECDKLQRNTEADFGCVKFLKTEKTHEIVSYKRGEPWQHWVMIPCPDCGGRGSHDHPGSAPCGRCMGTRMVRRYDDGFVGEERTRLHPKEKEQATAVAPHCKGCGRDTDISWVACPYCGTRLIEPPAKTEHVGSTLNIQGTSDEMIQSAMARKHDGQGAGLEK